MQSQQGIATRREADAYPVQRVRPAQPEPRVGAVHSATIPGLIASNAARWAGMVIDFDAVPEMNHVAARLIAARDRYKGLYARTLVPWPVIALIHERECSQKWALSIAQGDPWNAASIHVPSGRGPFRSWEEAAIDALTVCNHVDQWQHWKTVGGALTRLEMYNGLGYALMNPAHPSPYIWSRTNQYVSGKYVGDHDFDPAAIDIEQGCAPLLACMMAQDPTILGDFPSWGTPRAQPGITAPDGTVCDTSELPDNIKNAMKPYFVDSMDEVLALALESPLPSPVPPESEVLTAVPSSDVVTGPVVRQ